MNMPDKYWLEARRVLCPDVPASAVWLQCVVSLIVVVIIIVGRGDVWLRRRSNLSTSISSWKTFESRVPRGSYGRPSRSFALSMHLASVHSVYFLDNICIYWPELSRTL